MRKWSSIGFTLIVVAGLAGVANSARVLAQWASEPVTATPMAATLTTSADDTETSFAAYLALTRFQILDNPTAARDDAALKFIVYFLMSARAIPAKCAALGQDASDAARAFAELHAGEYVAASDALAPSGLNSERIGKLLQADIRRLSDMQLVKLAEALELDTDATCAWIAENPGAYAEARRYRSRYPSLHKLFALN